MPVTSQLLFISRFVPADDQLARDGHRATGYFQRIFRLGTSLPSSHTLAHLQTDVVDVVAWRDSSKSSGALASSQGTK